MRLLLLAAIVLLAIAVLVSAGVIHGTTWPPWATGGLLAWAIDVAAGGWTWRLPPGAPR